MSDIMVRVLRWNSPNKNCPLCGASGCNYGEDQDGAYLVCPSPACPPNVRMGSVAKWHVTDEEERKVQQAGRWE
jgi:hypothetical protein